VQGFHFGRPADAVTTRQLIAESTARPGPISAAPPATPGHDGQPSVGANR
jgi:hypothetical protein